MSAIYSFLQKRKLHENQHGFVMVVIAYVLSALMLILGSDVFYNIDSEAAGMDIKIEEETQNVINIGLYNASSINYTAGLTKAKLINPYGLSDTTEDAAVTETTGESETSTSGDTVWFFGDAMDGATFDSMIEQLGSTMNAKEEEKKAEAKVKSNKAKETAAATYGNITSKEMKMLERIVQAEAGGEDMVGKILIVNVVMNRVFSKDFPDTIKDVIFQKEDGEYQFSPVSSDRFWALSISEETKEAVERALDGEDYSKGALYFVARKKSNTKSVKWFDEHLDRLFKHGGHEFYK